MTEDQSDFLADPFVRSTLRRWITGTRPVAADAGVLDRARELGFLDDQLQATVLGKRYV